MAEVCNLTELSVCGTSSQLDRVVSLWHKFATLCRVVLQNKNKFSGELIEQFFVFHVLIFLMVLLFSNRRVSDTSGFKMLHLKYPTFWAESEFFRLCCRNVQHCGVVKQNKSEWNQGMKSAEEPFFYHVVWLFTTYVPCFCLFVRSFLDLSLIHI